MRQGQHKLSPPTAGQQSSRDLEASFPITTFQLANDIVKISGKLKRNVAINLSISMSGWACCVDLSFLRAKLLDLLRSYSKTYTFSVWPSRQP
jgi:hypothetical protein